MSPSLEFDHAVGPDGSAAPTRIRPSRTVTILIWGGFAVGFVIALIVIARPRWFPLLDLAQTEMRVRDVFTSHPPLIGLPGRIGTLARQGSHPGPLSFWALAPVYRLFGSSSWAMQVATATLNLTAIGATLLMARRRGSVRVVLGVGAALALLSAFYGPSVLTQAWNPYMPMMWFLVVVVGVWSVLCDDLSWLPFTTFAACFCLHTHISYLGLVGGLGGIALAWIIWSRWKRPGSLGARPGRSIGLAVAVIALTSIPMVVQEFTHSPGNLTLIWEHFTNPPETPIGLRAGLDVLLVHLNPWRLVSQQDATTGSVIPGVMFLGLWVASAVAGGVRRIRVVNALNVVLLVSLGLGLVSIANIFGFVWYYLMLWSWAINAFMMLAIGWVAVALGRDATHGRDRSAPTRLEPAVAAVASIVLVAALGSFAWQATTVEPPDPQISLALGQLVRGTVRAIDAGTAPGEGTSGRYQVTIADPISINSPLYGMLLELERAGVHAGLPKQYHSIVGDQRVVTRGDATAVVHISVGSDIARWRTKPGVVEVAYTDRRTPKQLRERTALRRELRTDLTRIGRTDLIPNLDENVFTASVDPELSPAIAAKLRRLLDIGEPSAAFIGPAALAEGR
ncbi:MAG: hypothetical protein JJE46_02790 [Acidimicrobiia bacterium]|nr:hypothetical protein [Acidimicrobiia bacterium]